MAVISARKVFSRCPRLNMNIFAPRAARWFTMPVLIKPVPPMIRTRMRAALYVADAPAPIIAAMSSDGSDANELKDAKIDLPRIEKAVREILLAVGENPDREGLVKTPSRVARAYAELMAGLQDDPRRHLKTVFRERYDEVVLLRDIEFHSLCEHHLPPFTGRE